MTTGRINQISIDLVLFFVLFCDIATRVYFLLVKEEKRISLVCQSTHKSARNRFDAGAALFGLCFDDLISVF